jgi:hypothetical protein
VEREISGEYEFYKVREAPPTPRVRVRVDCLASYSECTQRARLQMFAFANGDTSRSSICVTSLGACCVSLVSTTLMHPKITSPFEALAREAERLGLPMPLKGKKSRPRSKSTLQGLVEGLFSRCIRLCPRVCVCVRAFVRAFARARVCVC